MTSPEKVIYLELRDVLEIHADLFGISDEQAADHLRNAEGLHSVLARPKQYAFYQDADLALQGAVVCHGIAEGQLFVDGNKRSAAACLLAFLADNQFTLNCSEKDLADWMLALSAGETAEELAERVRGVMVPFQP
jgi:death-on-curing protein